MKRSLCVCIVLAAHVASAEPRHVLVLRAEGALDDTLRARIDTQVLKLAKNIPGVVEAADITFSDATAAAGCNWADAACKDQVLSTMGVDELVATSVMSLASGDLRVTVRRLPHGAAAQSGSTTIPAGQPSDARMNADIGPLFGMASDKATTPAPKAVTATPTTPAPKAVTATTTPKAVTTTTTTTTTPGTGTAAISTSPTPEPSPEPIVTPPPTTPEPTVVTAAPNNQITMTPADTSSRRRYELYGMGGGGALVVLGFIMWAEASSVQGDIDKAPTRTPTDFNNLRDLENKADSFSGAGNLFFIGGVVLGGVSGYLFWRDHRAGHTQQARIAPAVFDHGAGLTLSFGGSP
jgi:hypothetical protein